MARRPVDFDFPDIERPFPHDGTRRYGRSLRSPTAGKLQLNGLVEGLQLRGLDVNQVIPLNDGYSGSYVPDVVFAHWTASHRDTDTAAHAVMENHYQICVSRSGVVCVGGLYVRQAHGGSGRSAPINLARNGAMTAADMDAWQASGAGDDTDSMPNTYGCAVCLDNDGIGEVPPAVQYDAWLTTIAAILWRSGLTAGSYMDHATSTNRKIDLANLAGKTGGQIWGEVRDRINQVSRVPSLDVSAAVAIRPHPSNRGYWILADDGAVFTYGHIDWYGAANGKDSAGNPVLGSRAIDLVPTPSGDGYWILDANGGVHAYGHAAFHGSAYEHIGANW